MKSPSSPSALCQGRPSRGRTESLDFFLLLARPLPQENRGVGLMSAAWPAVAERKFGS